MDWSQFGIARRPFRPAVDTGSYYPTAGHEAARAAVAAAFARRDPVVLIDGPAGTGKSLVARLWLDHLPPGISRVMLPNLHAARPADLLQAILFDLNQPYQGLAEQELRLGVTAQLLAAMPTGHPMIVMIDEAQHLSPAVLEELRLLGNIETADGAALFLLLVAQPNFRATLTSPESAAFAQRVGVMSRIEPFSADESAAYLRHQVKAAGGNPAKVFDAEAVTLLAGACGGVARLLNRAASLAAELAAGAGATAIDVEAALEALTRLGLEPAAEENTESVVLSHPAKTDTPRSGRGLKPKAGRKRSA